MKNLSKLTILFTSILYGAQEATPFIDHSLPKILLEVCQF